MTTNADYQKVDLVDDHLAADYNRLFPGTLLPNFSNTETISATKALADSDCPFQYLTPSLANRDVKLAPEATSNHYQVIYNAGSTYNLVVKDDAGTDTYATLTPGEYAWFLPGNSFGWRRIDRPTFEYKLSVSVASNNLTLAITHLDGTTPSTARPLAFIINGTLRLLTTSLSVTKNAGTNWCNGGGSELATKEVDYFAYVLWNTTPATDVLDVGFARIPYGRVYSDFSSTTTNEKYLAFGNASTPTSTDDVLLLGRFAATLSAGAGYTWTVPTFTNSNLIHHPIYFTRQLSYTPTWAASGTAVALGNGTLTGIYQVNGHEVFCEVAQTMGTTTTYGTGTYSWTMPITLTTYYPMPCNALDNGTAFYTGTTYDITTNNLIHVVTSGLASQWAQTVPHTWASTDNLNLRGGGRW